MQALQIKNRLVPYLGLAVFVIFQLPHLRYPFYWDESWVYAPSVIRMYRRSVSLLPGAVPPDFSRGHPLFFQAACATWMNIFGSSNFSMHCFSLFVFCCLAASLYEILRRLFNPRAALLALAFLLLNRIFFVESAMVMTDVMIALFSFLCIYFFVAKRYFTAALFHTLLLFTKESGFVLSAIIALSIALIIMRELRFSRQTLLQCLSLAIPLMLIALFYCIQKKTWGWYMNPAHLSVINLSVAYTFPNLQKGLSDIFVLHNEYWFVTVSGLISLLAAWRCKKAGYLFVVPVLALVWLLTRVFSNNDVVFYVFVFGGIAAAAVFLFRPMQRYSDAQVQFIKLVFAFSLAYLYFCCVNFFEDRYLDAVVFMAGAVLWPLLLDFMISPFSTKWYAAIITGVVISGAINLCSYDYFTAIIYDRMDVQQAVVDYMEEHDFYHAHICCSPFLERIHLSDPTTGFSRSGGPFQFVTDTLQKQSQFTIMDNIDYIDPRGNVRNDTTFVLLKQFDRGDARAEIYQRK